MALESIGEILEFAIAREVDASEFYMQMANRAKNEDVRALFEEFAGIELEHKATLELELMKEGVVATTAGRIIKVEPRDYMAGVKLRADVERKDVLALAIEKEKASFRFYVDMAGMFEEGELREALISLAEEEGRHVVRFETEYEKIRKSRK